LSDGTNRARKGVRTAFRALSALAAVTAVAAATAADELYVSNYASNTITVYRRTAHGDASPVRTIRTGLNQPHSLGVDLLKRELFVANNLFGVQGASINVYALDANFPADTPVRRIAGPRTLLNRPAGIAVDSVHRELYVANDLGAGSSSIAVFPLGGDGNVVPLRVIQGPHTGLAGPLGLALDLVHDEVFVGNYKTLSGGSITVFPRTASGNVAPLRTLQGERTGFNNPQGIALDLARDEMIVANSSFATLSPGSVLVFPRTASGDVGPSRQLAGPVTGLCNPIGLVFDRVNAMLVVANSHASSAVCDASITTFPITASDDTPPKRRIGPGPHSALDVAEGVAVVTSVDCSDPLIANGTVCDDGKACTQTDTCRAGACVGGAAVVCAASDACHDPGVCDTGTGVCSNPVKPDGATCSDGSLCTQADACKAGVCTGGPAVVCTASDLCHVPGACEPSTGVCAAEVPVACGASDQCHLAGACDLASGICSNPVKPDGSACNDGNACSQRETCQAGVCAGGSSANCSSEELFVSNYAANTVTVYQRTAHGDVTPVRTIRTGLDQPHSLGVDLLGRELFVANNLFGAQGARINVYELDASFPADPPQRTITGPRTLLNRPAGIVVDSVHQELYVANDLGVGTSSITVFALAANGNVAPLRVIQGPQTGLAGPLGLGLDLVHDELFVVNYKTLAGGSITVFPRTASGNVRPLRTLQGDNTGFNNPQGIALDLVRDEMIVANSFFATVSPGNVLVFPRAASGNVRPVRQLSGPDTSLCNPIGLAYDRVNDVLVVANSHASSATCDGSITTFSRTAHDDAAPQRQIGPGPRSALDNSEGVLVMTRVDCSDPLVANGTVCDDGNACTQTDTCRARACVGGNPKVCSASDSCHEAGTCDPASGVCSNPVKPNSASCSYGGEGISPGRP